jgi:hypothetical protein
MDPALAETVITINGEERRATVDARTTVLDLLREQLGLTGVKKGCDHGQCGACTALLDGRRVNTCLLLAVSASGGELVTIEGLAQDGALAPAAAGVHRPRRVPVRLLHARADLLGRGDARRGRRGGRRADRRRDPRAHERQHLPLRAVREHRPGDRGGRTVKPFAYERATDPDGAVATYADGDRYLAGGTTSST